MDSTFTYIVGAGASANILPAIKDFPVRLEQFKAQLDGEFKLPDETFQNHFGSIDITKRKVQEQVIDSIKQVVKDAKKHSSIDTLARKYYLTGNAVKLRRLKAVIDVYLTAEQLFKGYDVRYDTFLATILTGGMGAEIALPPNIVVLSWNYDFQFELSAATFYRIKNIAALEHMLNIVPSRNYKPSQTKKFSILKLNGTAGAYTTDAQRNFQRVEFDTLRIKDALTNTEKLVIIETLMAYYFYSTYPVTDTTSSILFSWENDEVPKKTREIAQRLTAETEYLTIIGYSFPTFNREIDREIIGNMKNLKKVYIQIPSDDVANVEVRFKAICNNVEVVNLTSVNEFFIPYEY